MNNVLLIDFGSTYTKLTAVDVEEEKIIGTASAYTTVRTDINDGLCEGLKILESKTGIKDYEACYACSSAAGGLRMVTSGLVPELTGEAAKLASLGAGAKVVGIYSIADGMPEHMTTVYKGPPEPYAKRTVEGDIGMRYSIQGIVDAAGGEEVSRLSGLEIERVTELIEDLKNNTDKVPGDDCELENLDFALASCAVKEAVTRHAGTISETYTMMGQTFVQEGKNLTGVKQIVVTGGSLIHTKRTDEIASFAMYSDTTPQSLRPKNADIRIDRTYILASMGLLSSHYPETALRIMKKKLEYHGYSK